MPEKRQVEIDENFDFFQRNLGEYLDSHPGEYALLKEKDVVAFFPSAGDAYREGLKRFADRLFSVQEVRREPIELGHLALDPR